MFFFYLQICSTLPFLSDLSLGVDFFFTDLAFRISLYELYGRALAKKKTLPGFPEVYIFVVVDLP